MLIEAIALQQELEVAYDQALHSETCESEAPIDPESSVESNSPEPQSQSECESDSDSAGDNHDYEHINDDFDRRQLKLWQLYTKLRRLDAFQ